MPLHSEPQDLGDEFLASRPLEKNGSFLHETSCHREAGLLVGEHFYTFHFVVSVFYELLEVGLLEADGFHKQLSVGAESRDDRFHGVDRVRERHSCIDRIRKDVDVEIVAVADDGRFDERGAVSRFFLRYGEIDGSENTTVLVLPHELFDRLVVILDPLRRDGARSI